MGKLNADGLDESQFLPKKILNPKTGLMEEMPIVNAFRAAKGDIVRLDVDGGIHKALKWLPDILHNTFGENGKQLLDGNQLHVCESIYRIACSARAALGVSDLRNYILSQDIESMSTELDKFFLLLRGLLPYQSNICLWIVFDDYNRGNVNLAKRMLSNIYSSLDNAKKILDGCKQNA